jgi:hypothetical protein
MYLLFTGWQKDGSTALLLNRKSKIERNCSAAATDTYRCATSQFCSLVDTDRVIVKNKHKSIDNENEGEELENNVTDMNEQPPENQENQEDVVRKCSWIS